MLFPSRPFNLALAIKAEFTRAEAGRAHSCRIEIVRGEVSQADGEPIQPKIDADLNLPPMVGARCSAIGLLPQRASPATAGSEAWGTKNHAKRLGQEEIVYWSDACDAASLTQGVLKAMLFVKVKPAALVLVAAG